MGNKITIYHNPSCSKSCNALNALKNASKEIERIDYLKDVPSIDELRDVVTKLKCKPHDIIRTTESIYLEQFKGKKLSDEDWIKALHDYPILIQRPIVVKGNYAVVARSEDSLISLF